MMCRIFRSQNLRIIDRHDRKKDWTQFRAMRLSCCMRMDSAGFTCRNVCIVTLRGAIEARALVSRRTRPLQINGKTIHQVALPFHWGSAGNVSGGAANDLIPISGEPNVTIMETKALSCNIVPGRLPRGPAFEDWLDKYVPRGGPPNLHPEQPPPGARPEEKIAAGQSHESPTRQNTS